MKQFVIDRSKWRFGGDRYDTLFGQTGLSNRKGYMCCLGQICRQVGMPDMCLLNRSEPEEAAGIAFHTLVPDELTDVYVKDAQVDWFNKKFEDIMDLLVYVTGDRNHDNDVIESPIYNTGLAEDAMDINDRRNLSCAERERQLIELFKTAGYELTFSGEYQPQVLDAA